MAKRVIKSTGKKIEKKPSKKAVAKKKIKKSAPKNVGVTIEDIEDELEQIEAEEAAEQAELEQQEGEQSTTAITEPETPAEVVSASQNEPPKTDVTKKKGSRSNPRRFTGDPYNFVDETAKKPGWWELIFIESCEEPAKGKDEKWIMEEEIYFTSVKAAEKQAKEWRDGAVESLRRQAENKHSQIAEVKHNPTARNFQFTVKKKTSDKAIYEFVEDIKRARQEMRDATPPPKFEFTPPEYPKFRVGRRLVFVEDSNGGS